MRAGLRVDLSSPWHGIEPMRVAALPRAGMGTLLSATLQNP